MVMQQQESEKVATSAALPLEDMHRASLSHSRLNTILAPWTHNATAYQISTQLGNSS